MAVDDLKPVSIEFSAMRFAAVQLDARAGPADKSAAEQFLKGQPIWLGNLFDDPPSTPLAEAMLTDTFQAVPKPHASLGSNGCFIAASRLVRTMESSFGTAVASCRLRRA